ncbi:hypothetical protein HY383_01460 [Candidatus Daviesbacteria bacterium]|nr:hypothetical protein [Candidatus Daviesbacteria bacterium]
MMLQLLHGPAIRSSRERLVLIKGKFSLDNVTVFDGKTNLQQILANLQNQSLFESERLVVLENPPDDFQFPNFNSQLSIVLWFDHEVSKTKPIIKVVQELKGGILFFPEEREASIFPFLDYLAAGDKKAFVEIDKLKKSNFEIQYFITMVFYLLRNLVVTPKTAPQFVKDKLQKQRKNLSQDKIKRLYKDILEIDFKIKSGLLEKDQAEFLLVRKFIGS